MDFTNEMVFGFPGPNLCLLGNEADFRKLAELSVELTNHLQRTTVELQEQHFVENVGEERKVIFTSKAGGDLLAILNKNGDLQFELDSRVWERLFRYFVLMSWYKRTYYLNAHENCFDDFSLKQDVNFICSSAF